MRMAETVNEYTGNVSKRREARAHLLYAVALTVADVNNLVSRDHQSSREA